MGIVISNSLTVLNKLWLVVLALILQDVPVVESTSRLRVQVVLTDYAGPVASILKSFRERPLRLIKRWKIILHETINVRVFAS